MSKKSGEGSSGKAFLADRADRISRSLESDAMSALRVTLRRPVSYVNTVIDCDDEGVTSEEFSRRVLRVMSPQEADFMRWLGEAMKSTPGEDAIQTQRWARGRVVYVVDGTTAAAVHGTDWGDTVIPGEVLRRLPHPNPMVVLPEPYRIPNDEGNVEKYEAFMVLGMRPPRRRASTHHPETTHFVMHFLGRVVDPVTDRPVEVEVPRNALDPKGPVVLRPQVLGMRVLTPLVDMTMAERQAFAADDISRLGPLSRTGFESYDQAIAVTREMTSLALSVLVYLVTDDVDTSRLKVSDSRRGRRVGLPRGDEMDDRSAAATTVFEVGYRVGQALRAAHRQQGERGAAGDGRRSVAPHVRRAHVHTFRRGKNHSERFLKWLPPIPVNMAGARKAEKTQVHFPD